MHLDSGQSWAWLPIVLSSRLSFYVSWAFSLRILTGQGCGTIAVFRCSHVLVPLYGMLFSFNLITLFTLSSQDEYVFFNPVLNRNSFWCRGCHDTRWLQVYWHDANLCCSYAFRIDHILYCERLFRISASSNSSNTLSCYRCFSSVSTKECTLWMQPMVSQIRDPLSWTLSYRRYCKLRISQHQKGTSPRDIRRPHPSVYRAFALFLYYMWCLSTTIILLNILISLFASAYSDVSLKTHVYRITKPTLSRLSITQKHNISHSLLARPLEWSGLRMNLFVVCISNWKALTKSPGLSCSIQSHRNIPHRASRVSNGF